MANYCRAIFGEMLLDSPLDSHEVTLVCCNALFKYLRFLENVSLVEFMYLVLRTCRVELWYHMHARTTPTHTQHNTTLANTMHRPICPHNTDQSVNTTQANPVNTSHRPICQHNTDQSVNTTHKPVCQHIDQSVNT